MHVLATVSMLVVGLFMIVRLHDSYGHCICNYRRESSCSPFKLLFVSEQFFIHANKHISLDDPERIGGCSDDPKSTPDSSGGQTELEVARDRHIVHVAVRRTGSEAAGTDAQLRQAANQVIVE